MVSANDGGALTTADQQKVAALAASLDADKIPSVPRSTTSRLYLSPNKKVQLVQVVFTGQAGDPGPTPPSPSFGTRPTAFLAGSGLRVG